jgi:hypothetical protein
VPAASEDEIWDAYNLLLGGPDVERIRKMLTRYEFFRQTLELPGDIVEAGVFKGTCLMYFLKLIAIHCPGSIKRVVGFDLFEGWADQAAEEDKSAVAAYLAEANFEGTSPDAIATMVARAGFDAAKCELVAGDISETAAKYVADHPGFRISLLNLDLDLSAPTLGALGSRGVKSTHISLSSRPESRGQVYSYLTFQSPEPCPLPHANRVLILGPCTTVLPLGLVVPESEI